jgi:ribosomal protein S27E
MSDFIDFTISQDDWDRAVAEWESKLIRFKLVNNTALHDEQSKGVSTANNIECETCRRSLSTFGLIGDVITCDSCGTMNGISAKSEPIVPSASNTKLRIDPYGMWQRLVMP